MAARLQGRVTNISDDDLGSSLDGDHAAGATSIVVQNAADFDEDGGTLVINDQQIIYTRCDDDTDTITLAEGLAAAAEDGDTVSVWDPLREVIAVDKMASVDVGDGYADDIEAVVKLSLVDHLVEGPRGDDGESVVLEYDDEDDEWVVVDILGLGGPGASGTRWEQDDYYALTAADVVAGLATMPLSHRPNDEALTCVLAGAPQRPSSWTIDYNARTLTVPLSGWEQAGDVLWVHYAYQQGIATPSINSTVTVEIPWNGVVGTSSLALTGGHTAVGTGAILADGSDATYVNYSGANGEGATSSLALPSTPIPSSGFTAYAEWKTTFSGAVAEGFNVIVNQGSYGNVAGWYYTHADAESRVTDLGGGWKRFELEFPNGQAAFAQFVNGGSATAAVNCVGSAGKVYEARLVVTWDTAKGAGS